MLIHLFIIGSAPLHSYAIDQIGFVQPVFSINGEPAYNMIEEIKPSGTGTLNCVGKKYNAGGKMPFYFLTPVFDVSEAAFIQAFKDNKAVEGNYSGILNFTLRYYYFTAQGILTYRSILQQLAIQIYYKPDFYGRGGQCFSNGRTW